jgi:hypothetical protein
MKKLIDGTKVVARLYYYLLDFNEVNEHKFIYDNFGVLQLSLLNLEQFKILLDFAYKQDLNWLNSN